MDQVHTIVIIVCLSWTQDSNLSQSTQFHRKIERKKLQDLNKWDFNKQNLWHTDPLYMGSVSWKTVSEQGEMEVFTCGQKLDSAS